MFENSTSTMSTQQESHNESIECKICYTFPTKQTFMDCGECAKRICTDCFTRLDRFLCPYCRHSYVGQFEDEEDDETDDETEFYYDHEMGYDVIVENEHELPTDDLLLPNTTPNLNRQNAFIRVPIPMYMLPRVAYRPATERNIDNLPVQINRSDIPPDESTEQDEVETYDDTRYTDQDRYYNRNVYEETMETPDILQEFRESLRGRNRRSIRREAYSYVDAYIEGALNLQELADVLVHAKDLYRQ